MSFPRSSFLVPLLLVVGCGGQAQPVEEARLHFAAPEPREADSAFEFPSDLGGKLAKQRLSPPGHLPLPAPSA